MRILRLRQIRLNTAEPSRSTSGASVGAGASGGSGETSAIASLLPEILAGQGGSAILAMRSTCARAGVAATPSARGRRPRTQTRWARSRCRGRRKPASTARSRRATNGSQYPSTSSSADGLGVQPELAHVRISHSSSKRAEAAGEGDEAVGQVGHHRLALVHRTDDPQLGEALVGDLPAHEGLRDDADDLAAGGQHGVGQDAHQADVAAAVHEPEPAPARAVPSSAAASA